MRRDWRLVLVVNIADPALGTTWALFKVQHHTPNVLNSYFRLTDSTRKIHSLRARGGTPSHFARAAGLQITLSAWLQAGRTTASKIPIGGHSNGTIWHSDALAQAKVPIPVVTANNSRTDEATPLNFPMACHRPVTQISTAGRPKMNRPRFMT